MGFMVTREDPATGLDREYYKGDDGLLYNNYEHALAERASDPAVDAIVDSIGDGVAHEVEVAKKGFMGGVDSGIGYLSTDPSAMNISRFVRDVGKEALPGNQVTSLDQPFNKAEAMLKRGDKYASLSPTHVVATNTGNNLVGKVREPMAEKGLNYGLRKAGEAIGKKIPQYISKIAGGSALGPVGALGMSGWALYDGVDTGSQILLDKPIDQVVAETQPPLHADAGIRSGWSDGGSYVNFRR